MRDAPAGLGDEDGLRALAVALREAGVAGAVAAGAGARTARHPLVRLFVDGRAVDAHAAGAALGRALLERLVASGALVGGEDLRASFAVAAFEDLLLLSDFVDPAQPAADAVIGVGAAPRTLAWLTPRVAAGRVLDLGTGCGVQALLAARHSRSVVATDVNRRALAFAAANAVLNGVTGVEVRAGDRYEPVAGERFDLVVANPPFVVSPGAGVLYRDGGLDGDELCASVVRTLPSHLAAGGTGVVLCNWVQPAGAPWWSRLRSWCTGSGCHALLLRFGSDDVGTYVRRWNGPLLRYDARAYRSVEQRWLAYYDEHGITTIGAGAVVLRRTSGPARTRVLDVPHPLTGPAGPQVLRVLDAAAAPCDPEALLDTPVRPAAGWRTGPDGRGRTLVWLEPGLGVRVPLEPRAAAVVSALDGRPLRRAVDGAGLAAVRQLMALGMVEVAAAPRSAVAAAGWGPA